MQSAHIWEKGAEFGSDLAQLAAPLRPSSESSPDASQTQQQLGSFVQGQVVEWRE